MLDILKTVTPSAEQWEIAIEGMRNSFDSWDKSDSMVTSASFSCHAGFRERRFCLGNNDRELMLKLSESGSEVYG